MADDSGSVFSGDIFRPHTLTTEDNAMLDELPTFDEVKNAVFSLDRDSAPGVDGFSGSFFTHCWSVIGEDVWAAVKDFWAAMPKSFVSTLIVLIPKVSNPSFFADFRPISLCTFASKIITKTISLRLSQLLPKLISLNQTGFVKGRNIVDNVLLATELVHSINKKMRGGNLILKLDMMSEKRPLIGFLGLFLPFLIKVLEHFGFGPHFIHLIRNCLSFNMFSVR